MAAIHSEPDPALAADAAALTTRPTHNWHPAVHAKKYREHLYFYLVRFRDPHYTPVAAQLRRILERAGVAHACEYTVYGFWDGLVRTWLTPASHTRLRTLFEAKENNIDRVRSLQAEHVHYLWRGEEDLLKEDRKILSLMTKNANRIAGAVSGDLTDAESLAVLEEAGLLLRRPVTEPGSVKFYVVLEPAGELQPRSSQTRLVLSALRSAQMSERTSLYAGEGDLGPYLIRCVADTYGDVLSWTVALDKYLPDTHLRTMTLLIANEDARESDNVNDPMVISQSAEAAAQLLDLADSDRILLASLQHEEQIALSRIVEQAFQAAEHPQVQSRLEDMLRASVRDDLEAFKQSLSFLVDIEFYLGVYLKRALGDVYGDNWHSLVPQELAQGDKDAKKVAQEMQKPIGTWTLGSYVFVALETAKISQIFASRLGRQLGTKWRDRLQSLHALRNDFSHGRLAQLQGLRNYSGQSGEMLLDVIEVCAFANRCVELVENDE
jgi:hypothetical protein